jgi:glycosyltransferase involved in cell wall biosynthesis
MYIAIDFIGTNIGSGSKTYNINFCNQLYFQKISKKITIFISKNYYLQINNKIKNKNNLKFIIKPNFLSISFIRIFWIQFILPLELKILGIQKLYSPMNFSPILSNFFKIKVVLCCHSNLPWVHFDLMPGNKIKNYFVKKIMELSIRSCNVLLVNSYYAQKEIIKLLKLKKKKIEVIYLGLEKKQLRINNKKFLMNYFNYDEKYILSVISCVRYHNIINMLKAYKNLTNIIKYSFKFVLIMQILDKKYHQEINNFIKENFKANNIIILSDLEKKELYHFYQNAIAYVFSSYSEVFGFTTLEAMQHNLPVATSNKSALPEINGKAALYFNPDKIIQIQNMLKLCLLDNNVRQKLIKASKHNLKRFNLDSSIKKTLTIIDKL